MKKKKHTGNEYDVHSLIELVKTRMKKGETHRERMEKRKREKEPIMFAR